MIVLMMCTRRRHHKTPTPAMQLHRSTDYSERAAPPKTRPSVESMDDEDEQSAPFLPHARTVLPDTLLPRSMSTSTRDSIHSPALLLPTTPTLPLSSARHTSRPGSRLGVPVPEAFLTPKGLPNPYSEGHSWNPDDEAPASPTMDESPSVYSQPSMRVPFSSLKPASARVPDPDVPSTPTVTDLSRNTTAWSTVEKPLPSDPEVHTAMQPFKIEIQSLKDDRPTNSLVPVVEEGLH